MVAVSLPSVRAEAAPGGYAAAVTDATATQRRVFRGTADPESGAPVAAHTVFHIASLSKNPSG